MHENASHEVDLNTCMAVALIKSSELQTLNSSTLDTLHLD